MDRARPRPLLSLCLVRRKSATVDGVGGQHSDRLLHLAHRPSAGTDELVVVMQPDTNGLPPPGAGGGHHGARQNAMAILRGYRLSFGYVCLAGPPRFGHRLAVVFTVGHARILPSIAHGVVAPPALVQSTFSAPVRSLPCPPHPFMHKVISTASQPAGRTTTQGPLRRSLPPLVTECRTVPIASALRAQHRAYDQPSTIPGFLAAVPRSKVRRPPARYVLPPSPPERLRISPLAVFLASFPPRPQHSRGWPLPLSDLSSPRGPQLRLTTRYDTASRWVLRGRYLYSSKRQYQRPRHSRYSNCGDPIDGGPFRGSVTNGGWTKRFLGFLRPTILRKSKNPALGPACVNDVYASRLLNSLITVLIDPRVDRRDGTPATWLVRRVRRCVILPKLVTATSHSRKTGRTCFSSISSRDLVYRPPLAARTHIASSSFLYLSCQAQ